MSNKKLLLSILFSPLIFSNQCEDIELFFNAPMDGFKTNAKEFKVPSGLGSIRIKKIISNQKRRVDWKATREHDTKIYHLNFHTDGYYYKWFWHKKKALFTNKSAYSFSPTRKNKRTLASLLKSNSVEFFE